jgi:rRNA-processing protein FCF1
LDKLNEVYIEKARISNCELVFQLSFTDTSLLLLAKNNGASVLTRDRKLWSTCKKNGVEVFHLDQVLSAGDLISQRD